VDGVGEACGGVSRCQIPRVSAVLCRGHVEWHEMHSVFQIGPKRQCDELTMLPLGSCSGQKLRCVGSALSPNGLAFEEEGMVSLALMGDVLGIDPVRRQVST
jgi:hypothetical protein